MPEIDITGPMPDRRTDYTRYVAYVHAKALDRARREKRAERTPSCPSSFGAAIHQPAPRLDIEGWVA